MTTERSGIPCWPNALDKASALPLYQQVRANLERWVRHSLEPEHEIPKEQELGDFFGVSRVTVRQALALLVADGVLYRRRPRGPLYVAQPRVHQHLTRLRGFFTDDVLTAGMESHAVVLDKGPSNDVRARELLHLDKADQILRVERVHVGDGTPTALQISYLPSSLYPGLLEQDLANSLLVLIEHHYGFEVTKASQRIRSRPPTVRERSYLELGHRSWVIEVERVSFGSGGLALEYFMCVLPAERYDFTMELGAIDIERNNYNKPDYFASLSL